MGRFLVAWEFGEDLGHVRRVLAVGRALRDRGHDVAFAFRDATRLAQPARERFGAWPAPVLRRPSSPDPAPVNAADVLLNLGFCDVAALRGVQRAWDALVAAARPQVLICDYAPNALLAAARHGLPRATVGSGFALPRAYEPLPAIRAGARTDEATLRGIDHVLRENVAKATGASEPPPLATLFEGDANLLLTLPELDPLGPREAEYLGPMPTAGTGLEVAWNAQPAPRVLAYLKPRDARFAALLDAFERLGVQAIVAAPGLLPESARARSRSGVRVYGEALALPALLAQADLCVGHGGPGFAADALRAGVPLLLLPMHLEQELVARRLTDAGVAHVYPGTAADLEAALAAALADRPMQERARRFGQGLVARGALDAASRAALRAEALLP